MAGRPRKIAEEFQEYSTAEAILLAAERICGEEGLSAVKLREVARRVGIEPASIYNHYKGLDGVLSAVVVQALDIRAANLEMPEGLVPREQIRLLCLRDAQFLADRKGIARMVLQDFAEVHDSKPNAFDLHEKRIVEILDMESAILAQLFETPPPRARLGQIAMVRGNMIITLLAQRWMNGWDTGDADIEQIAELSSAFILGLPAGMETEN